MGSSEKFCLRWNDFESNISVAFREIREEKDFFDCTLSCGSRQIQAHKLILSACSPFFRSILRQNPHQHPLLYLKGVEFTDLQAVLNFMYHGEVNVAQEELNSFLAVAEDLKVKGLTQNNSSDTSSAPKPKSEPVASSTPRPRPPPRDVEEPPAPKRPRPPPPPAPVQSYHHDDDDIQEVMPVVKQEPPTMIADPLPPTQQPLATMPQTYQPTMPDPNTIHHPNTVAQIDESYGDDGYDYGGYGEEEQYEGAMMEAGAGGDQNKGFVAEDYIEPKEDGKAKCCICGKDFIQKSDAKRHIMAKHSGLQQQISCNVCGKAFKNKPSLGTHLRTVHSVYKTSDASQLVEAVFDNYQPNVEKYRCVQCGKVFSDKSNCRRHVKLVHFGEKEPQDNCPLCQKLMLKKHINHHARNSCPQRQMY